MRKNREEKLWKVNCAILLAKKPKQEEWEEDTDGWWMGFSIPSKSKKEKLFLT